MVKICQYENIIVVVVPGRSSGTLIHEYGHSFQLHTILVDSRFYQEKGNEREKKNVKQINSITISPHVSCKFRKDINDTYT